MGRRRRGKGAKDAKWHGVLNVNKPSGVTSRDVVNVVQRRLRPAKVGHAGTLDPLACGVLVVCVGQATRLIRLVQQLPKVYLGEFQLGAMSDTDDSEGEVRKIDAPLPTREQIATCLPNFVGDVMQQPPAYSAIRVQGKRAYDLARDGEDVQLQPRPVRIDSLEMVDWAPPKLTLHIVCGSGVYIRSIGRDLGQQLGCGAIMTGLERSAIGSLERSGGVALERLESADSPEELAQFLLPVRAAADHLPTLVFDESRLTSLGHGQKVPLTDEELGAAPLMALGANQECQIVDQRQQLRAIAKWDRGAVRATINFLRREN